MKALLPRAEFSIALVSARPIRKVHITPSVTFVITAYNEEKRIGEKLPNTLAINYPKERFEVLVASACSTDKRDEIVMSYRDQGVRKEFTLDGMIEQYGRLYLSQLKSI